MQIINDLFQNGSLWTLIGTILYVYKGIEPVLKSNLRNNHEKSLLACSDRIIPAIAKVTDASPSDRKIEAISELNEFASKRHIPLSQKSAESYINKAVSDFKRNGGKLPDPKNIKNSINNSINEVTKRVLNHD